MATVLLAGSLGPAMVACTSRMPYHSLVQHSQSFCPVTNLTKSLSPESAHEQADCAMGTAALATVLPGFKFIHATAVVHPDAVLGKGVIISAFCTVGPAVTLGIGCKLHAGSHVCGNTIIGDYCKVLNGAVVGSDIPGQTVIGHDNTIGYNAVVGIKCQDMKYKEGDECSLYIGDNNDIREHVSIHRSSKPNDDTVRHYKSTQIWSAFGALIFWDMYNNILYGHLLLL
ncbi:hypothetical protein CY35_03G107600 [Sphagnum magellanicum]|nr:hypothetical protein CY35_03G107600 [Sphagnum magellanicum]